MRVEIEASPDELLTKSEALVRTVAAAVHPYRPDVSGCVLHALEKARHNHGDASVEARYPILRSQHDTLRADYARTLKAMNEEIVAAIEKEVESTHADHES